MDEEAISNAAADLWSWLPSYDIEKDPPPPEEIMREACEMISEMRDELQFGGLDD